MFNRKIKLTLFITLLVLSGLACGTLNVGVEQTNDEPTPLPPTQPTETNGANGQARSGEGPSEDYSAYWTAYQDPEIGFRFAVPCFWRVEFPDAEFYNLGSGTSYSLFNYPEEYPLGFPRGQGVFEAGGLKMDFGILNVDFYEGLPADPSLEDFLAFEHSDRYHENTISQVTEVEEITVNGQPGVFATVHYNDSDTDVQFYLFKLNPETILHVSAYPDPNYDNPDIQGIINSLAFQPETTVQIPTNMPANPPEGLAAACIGLTEAPPDPDAPPEGCIEVSFPTVEDVVVKMEEYLQTANTGGIVWEIANETTAIGYWRSEGITAQRLDLGTMLANDLYNYNVIQIAEGRPSSLTFTSSREEFPDLGSIPLENMFGPDVKIVHIVYSQGWGQDGNAEVLLFFAEDGCGQYYWHGMLYSGIPFNATP